MSEPERYFYHSFPRRFRDDPDSEIDRGLEVLSSIIASGFLLSPEETKWKEPLRGGSFSKPVKNIAKTCSFTELAPRELPKHSRQFGSFSIEFDLQTFRELGGIPVFYLPRATPEDRGLESLAASLMVRTGEIQVLLNRLADVENEISANVDKNRFIDFEKNGQQDDSRCSYGGAEDLIASLTDGGQPVNILRNALRALSAFFYPAERSTHTGFLTYYEQREWRLIANMAHLGQDIDRDLTDPEKARLTAIDSDFFSQKMKFHTGTYNRVEQCRFFSELNGKRVIQYARRVIVPSAALDQATDLLADATDAPVVALEELDSCWLRRQFFFRRRQFLQLLR